MALQPLSILYTGVFLAVVAGLYGWFIGILWSPFLLTERFRRLFESLPPFEWLPNYVLWIPLPAVVWGFFFGAGISLSRDVLSPGKASELYAAGVDGIVIATAVSLVVWPVVLLYVLPRKNLDWDPNGYSASTVLLVVTSLLWYLVFLIGPAYVISVFAGFGDAMTGP
ncbi:hypothetical protein [Natronomonas sp.]|uniref:hypothetical protein n=1 Tax=Natronomonas sp. TaxID=2184060 RepID=UPI002FC3007B